VIAKKEREHMTKGSKILTAMTLGLGIAGIAIVQGQQKKAWSLGALTPMDYIEIQQLVARYPYALDRGTDHGRVYADLFTADGVFHDQNDRYFRGPKELATIADRGEDAPQNVGHFMMNHTIEPGPNGGAIGKQYLMTISAFGEEKNGRKAASINEYHYEDVYQKTPDGWRFKSRTVITKKGRAPQPQVSSAPAR
jgi:hypothetical protein